MRLLLIFLLAISTPWALAAAGDTPAFPEPVAKALEESKMDESYMIAGPGNSRAVLMDYMRVHWRSVIGGGSWAEMSFGKRTLLTRACDDLSPTEFLEFLEYAKSLHEAGRLQDSDFLCCTCFSRYKQCFLEINIEDPRVQDLVKYEEVVYRKAGLPVTDPFSKEKISKIREEGIEQASLENPDLLGLMLPRPPRKRWWVYPVAAIVGCFVYRAIRSRRTRARAV